MTPKTETAKKSHEMLSVPLKDEMIKQLPKLNMLSTSVKAAGEGGKTLSDSNLWQPDTSVHQLSHERIAEDEHIYRQTFCVRSYEIDCDQKASFGALMNYSQDVIINHIEVSGLMVGGFGVTSEMNRRNLIWVFSSMRVAVDSYPSWGDIVRADTWFSLGKNRLVCNCLLTEGKTGQTLMRATSFCVMINKHTRKLSKVVEAVRVEMEPLLRTCNPNLHNGCGKLQKWEEDTADYIRGGLTGTSASVRRSHELGAITVEYLKECGMDSKLESLSVVSEDGSGRYMLDHLLRLENGTEMAKARTEWRPKHKKSASISSEPM
ncbi:hypothetical protein Ancab_029442 [Ancistrocladus abbreviatus]